jgi:hypothetical protein
MKTIADLKKRLEALPGRRIELEHEDKYAQFLSKATASKQTADQVSIAIPLVDSVLPTPHYKESQKKLNTAARIATGIALKIKKDPAAISDSGIDTSFIKLAENSNDSLSVVTSEWEKQIHNKVKDWEVIAGVIEKISEGNGASSIKTQAKRLKGAIDSLRDAKTKLPQTKEGAAHVKTEIDVLTDSVAKLDLNTPFGKFLQATASPDGADLALLENKDVSAAIEKHKLEKVFRVRVS